MKKKSGLDQLDSYFESKKESEIQVIYGLAFVVIIGLIYLIVFPMSQSFFDIKESAYNDITKKLNEANSYLVEVSGPGGNDRNYKINQEKQRLQMENNKFEVLRTSNIYFDNKLKEVSNLTYSEKNWAIFLDSLTSLAEENNIKLYSLQSQRKEPVLKKPEEVLNINLNIEGSFTNILRYINSIEESEMIVDVNGLDINSTGNNLSGKMKISVWGMKY